MSRNLKALHPDYLSKDKGGEEMKREITVHYSRTINTGNYSSQRVDMGIIRDLEVGENFTDALNDEYCFVKKFVNSKIKKIFEGLDK